MKCTSEQGVWFLLKLLFALEASSSYYLVWTLFSIFLWNWFFCGSSEIPFAIRIYRTVWHMLYVVVLLVYIRTREVLCFGKYHLAITTNKNISVVSNCHMMIIWCLNLYFKKNIFIVDYCSSCRHKKNMYINISLVSMRAFVFYMRKAIIYSEMFC